MHERSRREAPPKLRFGAGDSIRPRRSGENILRGIPWARMGPRSAMSVTGISTDYSTKVNKSNLTERITSAAFFNAYLHLYAGDTG